MQALAYCTLRASGTARQPERGNGWLGSEARLIVQKNPGADSLARWVSERTDEAGALRGVIEKVRSTIGKHTRKRSAHCSSVKHEVIRLDV